MPVGHRQVALGDDSSSGVDASTIDAIRSRIANGGDASYALHRSMGDDQRHLADAGGELDAARRDLLRATSQLSAVKDECESLERKVMRLEQNQKTSAQEIDNLEDANRRLRREADDLKREKNALLTTRTELHAKCESLQTELQNTLLRLQREEAASEARGEQQTAFDAVLKNLQEQHAVALNHGALLQDQRRTLEDEARNSKEQLASAQRTMESWKHAVLKEVDLVASTLERAFARGASSSSFDDELAMVALVGVDASSSSPSSHYASGLLDAAPHPQRRHSPSTSPSRQHHLVASRGGSAAVSVDAKPLFTSLYQSMKTLQQFLSSLRRERRESDDHVASIQGSCSTAERELGAALSENRHLSQRALQAEVQVTRLSSQLDTAKRHEEEATSALAVLVSGLGDALRAPSHDGPAIETQVRLAIAERDQLAERCRHQQETIAALKAEVVDVRNNAEERLSEMERQSREDARHERAVMEARMAAAVEDKRRMATDAAASQEHHEHVVQTLNAELHGLQQRLQETTRQVDKLEPEHRQLTRQVPYLEEQLAAREREVVELRSTLNTAKQEHRVECDALRRHIGPYQSALIAADVSSRRASIAPAGTHHTTSPNASASSAGGHVGRPASSFCGVFELLVLTLRVLHGTRRDLQDMSWQRRCLTSVLLEYQTLFGPLSHQYVTSKPLRRILRLRSFVVAVLAANRLLSLVRGQRHLRESFYSTRRGYGRVRLSPEHSVVVAGGALGPTHPTATRSLADTPEGGQRTLREQDFVLPSCGEADDIPTLMTTLLEQIKAPTRPPPSAWCHVAPPLMLALQGGLQRLYIHLGRPNHSVMSYSGGSVAHRTGGSHHAGPGGITSPQRGPSLVYPAHMQSVGDIASPPPSVHKRRPTGSGAFVSGGGEGAYGADESLRTALPQHHHHHAHPSAAALSSPHRRHTLEYTATPFAAAAYTPFRPHEPSSASILYPGGSSDVSSRGAMMPQGVPMPNGNDEFSSEVLNVIRALDNKVAGALRLHHTPAASGSTGRDMSRAQHTPKSALRQRR